MNQPAPTRSSSNHSLAADQRRFRCPMLLFVHVFDGSNDSLTGVGGSSFARADFNGLRRGASG
jgi:hypothetical protein